MWGNWGLCTAEVVCGLDESQQLGILAVQPVVGSLTLRYLWLRPPGFDRIGVQCLSIRILRRLEALQNLVLRVRRALLCGKIMRFGHAATLSALRKCVASSVARRHAVTCGELERMMCVYCNPKPKGSIPLIRKGTRDGRYSIRVLPELAGCVQCTQWLNENSDFTLTPTINASHLEALQRIGEIDLLIALFTRHARAECQA
jgi:hypothetical protein